MTEQIEVPAASETSPVAPLTHWVAGLAIFALCLWLRLDQFFDQVLIDDEWHAVHQLILRPPGSFLFSFGEFDYSIPLALLYWLEAQWFGLSEWAMRWPMMLAGVASIIVFPWWARGCYGRRTALLFALLLAISPMLINYSRFARPYALTLLLGYLVHFAFWRFWTRQGNSVMAGAGYVVGSALCAWLHLISLPFVIAPLLTVFPSAIHSCWQGERAQLYRLVMLGLMTAAATAALILPPLLGDPAALLGKTGTDLPNLDTFKGVWHMWLGTPSKPAVILCLALALAGVVPLYRQGGSIVKSTLTGLALTLALIVYSQPAWIQNPLTLARYLLPTIVVLLLAVAVGTARLAQACRGWLGGQAAAGVWLLPVAALLIQTPLIGTMRQPNDYTLHSVFQTDYRTHREGIDEFMQKTIPLSPWWQTLHESRSPFAIAATPYQFVSFYWDAPRWETLSGHRVIPGALSGLCIDRRDGEVPGDMGFSLRNAVQLADAGRMREAQIGYVVYQRPFVSSLGGPAAIGAETAHCLDALRTRFGDPVYEDDKLVVFPCEQNATTGAHAE